MIKKIPLALFFIVSPSAISAEEKTVETVSESTQPLSKAVAVKPRPRPQQASQSISRFLNYFYALISHSSIANYIKTVEKMFASLMHASYQAVQIAKPHLKPQKRIDSEYLVFDPELLDNIANQIGVMLKEYQEQKGTRKPKPRQTGMDEETKKIVQNVREITSSFLDLVEDPENPKTVPENIKGLLGGIINIGTIIMTSKGAPPLDADYEECKAYAQQLDEEVKEALYRAVMIAYERSSVSFK